MKKTVLIILGTVLSLALIGQRWQIFEPFNSSLDSIIVFYYFEKDSAKSRVVTYEYKDTLVIQKNFVPDHSGGLELTGRIEYHYDTSRALTEIDAGPRKCFIDGCFTQGGRRVYSYNADGTIASIATLRYYEETNEWEDTNCPDPEGFFNARYWGGSVFYSYDQQKNLIEERFKSWDRNNSDWTIVLTIIHEYTEGNRVASCAYMGDPPDFEDSGIKWQKEREFDQYGNCIKEIKTDADLENTSIIEYEYDLLGELLLKETEISGGGNKTECRYAYNNNGDLMEKRTLDENHGEWLELYYYRYQINTEIAEKTVRKIEVFPNPFVKTVTIRTLSEDVNYASIIDLNGRINMNIEWIGPVHQLDLTSLSKGIYFITVRSMDQVWTSKIIKL